MSIVYLAQAKELTELFHEDQEESKEFSRRHYWQANVQDDAAKEAKAILRSHVHARARRMLEILDEIGAPSIANIGKDAAQAVPVLATHASLAATHKVLAAFEACYARDRNDTYYQAIPPMTDWTLLLSRKPQRFGTFWLFDKDRQPYLPTVEEFACINERRAEYDIEPLRWPKSLAIPESDQPWLTQPISQLVMRDPTDEEFDELVKDFV